MTLKETVLVVDDEDEIREMLVDLVHKAGYSTATASNGTQALEAVSARDFATVICDIGMPSLTGLDFLAKCRLRNVATPVIFVTGMDNAEVILKAVRLGAADFVTKPFKSVELTKILTKVIELGRAEQALARVLDEALAQAGNEELMRQAESLRFRINGMKVLLDRSRSGPA